MLGTASSKPTLGDSDEDSDDSDGGNSDDSDSSTLLNIESIQFKERFITCRQDFDLLVEKHRNKMRLLISKLSEFTKKGVLNYLNEALIRFNFNSFYLGGSDE